jgi:hypothetical protein
MMCILSVRPEGECDPEFLNDLSRRLAAAAEAVYILYTAAENLDGDHLSYSPETAEFVRAAYDRLDAVGIGGFGPEPPRFNGLLDIQALDRMKTFLYSCKKCLEDVSGYLSPEYGPDGTRSVFRKDLALINIAVSIDIDGLEKAVADYGRYLRDLLLGHAEVLQVIAGQLPSDEE